LSSPARAPAPPSRVPRFGLAVVPDRERVRVVPTGDLDLATADQVWDEIERLREAGFDRIVLDLRQLTFMDSTALRLIVRARNTALKDGFEFALIDGAEPVCRVLDITGLREHLTFARP
jgi:anti-sigma B factor antagonist